MASCCLLPGIYRYVPGIYDTWYARHSSSVFWWFALKALGGNRVLVVSVLSQRCCCGSLAVRMISRRRFVVDVLWWYRCGGSRWQEGIFCWLQQQHSRQQHLHTAAQQQCVITIRSIEHSSGSAMVAHRSKVASRNCFAPSVVVGFSFRKA